MKEIADRLGPLPTHILIALSGGADSLALTRALVYRREAEPLWLEAVHVNHHLRGEEADADEAFVTEVCQSLDIPLHVRHLTPPEHPSEGWAREARYQAFAEVYATIQPDVLALAHHQDDQAETLLLHLLRGSGLKGLTAMPRESVLHGMMLLRPMLGCTHQELTEALRSLGQPWREDSTNRESVYLRNRVRHELMPLMETLAPGAAERLATTATILRDDEAALVRMTDAFLAAHPGWHCLPRQPLLREPEGLRKRVLRTWWHAETGTWPDAITTARMEDALQHSGASLSLSSGAVLKAGAAYLHCVREFPVPAPEPVAACVTMHGVQLNCASSLGSHGDGKTAQELPQALLQDCVWRTRMPGDFIRPFGSHATQSLQDYLVNRKVEAPFRRAVPLLCRGREVLWAAGVGAGAVPHWREEDQPVRLTAQGSLIDCLIAK